MEKVATTFRIDPVIKAGLQKLSDIQKVSLNKLANKAIEEFVERRTADVEQELEATLKDLRAYRRKDPNFEKAIAGFAEAEVLIADDPAEGQVVAISRGESETAILEVLNG